MEQENAVRIAVVEEQIRGLREQAKVHADQTQIRFDRLEGKVDTLVGVMNRGRGAYAASLAIAGIIGAAVLKAIDWVVLK